MRVTLKSFTPNPEQAITEAAAVCHKSVSSEKILPHIIKAGHWTPLEFANFHFRIEGVSRALTHQLVRKRVGVAFCQESQRYIGYDDNGFDYVTPPSIKDSTSDFTYCNKDVQQLFTLTMRIAESAYAALLELGVPKEDARFVLPNACCSTIDMSVNYHALLDLCKERLCTKAQWEIRELFDKIKEEVKKVSPTLAEYMQPKCYWLKHCPEKTPCKVFTGG